MIFKSLLEISVEIKSNPDNLAILEQLSSVEASVRQLSLSQNFLCWFKNTSLLVQEKIELGCFLAIIIPGRSSIEMHVVLFCLFITVIKR